jgi:hypothetical protein
VCSCVTYATLYLTTAINCTLKIYINIRYFTALHCTFCTYMAIFYLFSPSNCDLSAVESNSHCPNRTVHYTSSTSLCLHYSLFCITLYYSALCYTVCRSTVTCRIYCDPHQPSSTSGWTNSETHCSIIINFHADMRTSLEIKTH